jgi:hypothetical protein
VVKRKQPAAVGGAADIKTIADLRDKVVGPLVERVVTLERLVQHQNSELVELRAQVAAFL